MIFDPPCIDSFGNDICKLRRQNVSAMGHLKSQKVKQQPRKSPTEPKGTGQPSPSAKPPTASIPPRKKPEPKGTGQPSPTVKPPTVSTPPRKPPTVSTPTIKQVPEIPTTSGQTSSVDALIDNVLQQQRRNDDGPRLRLPKEMYKLHSAFLQDFNLQHPDVSPEDILAAEISTATYIEDPAMLDEYINNVSSIRKKGYILDPDERMSNEYMKTFLNPKTGNRLVAYRGTVNWTGQDGIANVSNTLGTTLLRQRIKENTGVDFRFKKAKLVRETNEYIASKGADRVVLTSGHSQGAFEGVQGGEDFFTSARIITFNPAPGGHVSESRGKSFVTPNDYVSVAAKTLSEVAGSSMAKVVTVNSRAPTSFSSIVSGGHGMAGSFAAPKPKSKTVFGGDVDFTVDEIRAALRSSDDSFTSFMRSKGVTNLSTLSPNDDIVKTWSAEYEKMTASFGQPEAYRQQFPAFNSEEFDAIHESYKPPPIPKGTAMPNILSRGVTALHGTTSLGIGMATGHLLSELGVDNPYANAAISGGVAGATPSIIRNSVNTAMFSLTKTYGARITGEQLLTQGLKGGVEGALLAPVQIGIDQLLNGYYRRAGMSIAGSNALSGFVSTVSVGALGIATSVAAGELAIGPEMLPVAAMTVLMGEIVAIIQAKQGKDEESMRKENTNRVNAQYNLIEALGDNEYDVDRAKASLSAADQKLIDTNFMQTVTNAMEGKQPPASGIKSSADIQREHQKKLNDMKSLALAGVNQQYAMRQYQVDLDTARTRERMQVLQGKLISAHMTAIVNGTNFVDPLTDAETDELSAMDPDYSRRAVMYAHMYNARAMHYATQQQALETSVIERVQNGEIVELTSEQRQMLANDETFAVRFHEHMKPIVDQENADALGLSLSRYLDMTASIHNGDKDEDTAYLDALKSEARDRGYADVQNYVDDLENGDNEGLLAEIETRKNMGFTTREQYQKWFDRSSEPNANPDEIYKSMMVQIVRDAGYTSLDDYLSDVRDGTQTALKIEQEEARNFNQVRQQIDKSETLDEYRYKSDMSEWSPEISQILRAHEMGLTSLEFQAFQRTLASAEGYHEKHTRETAFLYATTFKYDDSGKAIGVYSDQDYADMQADDYRRLQTDLKLAGYDPNLYNPDFTRNKSISDQKTQSSVSEAVASRDAVDQMIQDKNVAP